ncbi:MAG: hypothetical protein P8I02_04975 [Flavobacteriales bacterium]|nr:hypothetical protein [Flavobacteriales bacterium]
MKIFSFEDKIEFKRFGIITIGNHVNYIGKHLWKINFLIKDSLFSISLESKTNDKFIYYNLSEKLEIKELDVLEKNETLFTIYKDLNKIFENKTKINFKINNSYFIQTTEKPKNTKIRGEIKDFYKIEIVRDKYILVRTVQKEMFICWYILKNQQIINIHTERKKQKDFNYGQIIVTDILNENIPEFTFIYKNKDNIKFITLSEKNKITTDKGKLKTYDSFLDMSVYIGFLHYNLKKIG